MWVGRFPNNYAVGPSQVPAMKQLKSARPGSEVQMKQDDQMRHKETEQRRTPVTVNDSPRHHAMMINRIVPDLTTLSLQDGGAIGGTMGVAGGQMHQAPRHLRGKSTLHVPWRQSQALTSRLAPHEMIRSLGRTLELPQRNRLANPERNRAASEFGRTKRWGMTKGEIKHRPEINVPVIQRACHPARRCTTA